MDKWQASTRLRWRVQDPLQDRISISALCFHQQIATIPMLRASPLRQLIQAAW